MHFDLKHLGAFVAVAEELNFHRAAERLALAQPAVSRLIQELETRLGCRLLDRTTRSVRLTVSGRYLLDEARHILKRMETAEQTAKMLATGRKGTLRIGYTTITGHSLVPMISREFRNTNPNIRLDLSYHSAPEQRDMIIRDEIDVGFLVGQFKSSEIETRHVASHSIVALMPPDHPLTRKSELTIAELAREPLVMGTNPEWPTFRRIVVDMFQKEGHVMQVEQEATSLVGILGLVIAGMGITLFCGVPRVCGKDVLVSRPIATRTPVLVETYVAWKRSRMNASIQRFIATSRAVGGQKLWS